MFNRGSCSMTIFHPIDNCLITTLNLLSPFQGARSCDPHFLPLTVPYILKGPSFYMLSIHMCIMIWGCVHEVGTSSGHSDSPNID